MNFFHFYTDLLNYLCAGENESAMVSLSAFFFFFENVATVRPLEIAILRAAGSRSRLLREGNRHADSKGLSRVRGASAREKWVI